MDMNDVINGLDEKELDYSTYNLYYTNAKIPLIKQRIENLFRKNNKLNIQRIIKNLENEFTEDEIRKSLHLLLNKVSKDEDIDYLDFIQIYSRSPVKKVMNLVEGLFKTKFYINFQEISENLGEYSMFEILTALRNIINENVILINKYGFQSYLREDKNVFFLVSNLSVESNLYNEYYTLYPHIGSGLSYEEIKSKIYSKYIPILIKKLKKSKSLQEFETYIKILPVKVQEMFIETSIIAKEKDIKTNVQTYVTDIFTSYIKKLDELWVSTLLKSINGKYRCKNVGIENEWVDCEEGIQELLQEENVKRQQEFRDNNKYKIMGKYNKLNKSFCILDFQKEIEAVDKRSDKTEEDKRLFVSGRVCKTFTAGDLIRIASDRLRIPIPEKYKDFMLYETREELLDKLRNDEIFTEEELKQPRDNDDLRRMLYWSDRKKIDDENRTTRLCNAIYNWLKEHSLLDENDNTCGVRGKNKIKKTNVNTKELFNVQIFKKEQVEPYSKDISRIMKQCITQEYKESNKDSWALIFYKKKLIGFMIIKNEENIISNICINKKYTEKDIGKEAIKYVFEKIQNKPIIILENSFKDYDKLLTLYESFGFLQMPNSNSKNTYLSYAY
jgi:hypothetical protein